MLVKYVKQGVSGKIGDIRRHDAKHVQALQALGLVVPYEADKEAEPNQAPDQSKGKKRGRPAKADASQKPVLNGDDNESTGTASRETKSQGE